MVRSMIAGVAGLKAHQSKMDVIGNNIANVNTWGFKGYRYNFMDSMYTNSIKSSGGSVEAGAAGGRNASQVGYGSQLSSISNVFETGAPAPSSDPMDCMIDGTGFFLVGGMINGAFTDVKSSGLSLSRVGIFRVDSNKYLVDDQRNYVYGYSLLEGTGVPERVATPTKVKLTGVNIEFTEEKIMDKDGNDTGKVQHYITIAGEKVAIPASYDNSNNPSKAVEEWVDRALTNSKFDGYTIEYNGITRVMTDPRIPADPTNNKDEVPAKYVNLPSFTITSNTVGADTETDTENIAKLFTLLVPNDPAVNGSGFEPTSETEPGVNYEAAIPAQYAKDLSTLRIPVDPYTGVRYNLTSYSILEDGTITGVDEQERAIVIGKVALVQVQNPNGLEKGKGYYYSIGENAGDVTVGIANGTTSTIKGGYLEMANVDLADEFSSIITTQRGFQANSKIITVTDEMLQELVNMKR